MLYCKAQCKLKQPSYFISQWSWLWRSNFEQLFTFKYWVMLLKSMKKYKKCFLLFWFLDLEIYTYHYCYRYHIITYSNYSYCFYQYKMNSSDPQVWLFLHFKWNKMNCDFYCTTINMKYFILRNIFQMLDFLEILFSVLIQCLYRSITLYWVTKSTLYLK